MTAVAEAPRADERSVFSLDFWRARDLDIGHVRRCTDCVYGQCETGRELERRADEAERLFLEETVR